MAAYQTDPNLIAGYLSDESGLAGRAEGICFPGSADEAAQALVLARREGKAVTIQGARTGYYGQAVPHGGYLLNLSRLNRFLGFSFDPETGAAEITVEAGVTLDALDQVLRAKSPRLTWDDPRSDACWRRYRESGLTLFFPPNPTEGSATLGGVLSTGATGSHDHAYGGVWEQTGRVRRAEKGGVITACTLRLAVRPAHTCALFAFCPDYPSMLGFLALLKQDRGGDGRVLGAEFFDRSCFRLAREQAGATASLGQLPALPASARAGLCLELAADGEEGLFTLLEQALEAMEHAGLPAEEALAATTPKEAARLLNMRHLLTETANALSYGKPKLALERTLPSGERDGYPALLAEYSDALSASRLSGCLFGHAGLANLHLRLLPEGVEEERLAAGLLQL